MDNQGVSVVLVAGEGLFGFVLGAMQRLTDVGIVVLGFGALPVICYETEVEGESHNFSDLCNISTALDCVLVAGCDTDLYGIKHRSATVIDKGKLINVSDMVSKSEDFASGQEYNVYATSAGKVGILIDKDIYNFHSKFLRAAGCDYIVAVVDEPYSLGLESVIKDNALNQCDVVCVTRDKAFLAAKGGVRREVGEGFLTFRLD